MRWGEGKGNRLVDLQGDGWVGGWVLAGREEGREGCCWGSRWRAKECKGGVGRSYLLRGIG